MLFRYQRGRTALKGEQSQNINGQFHKQGHWRERETERERERGGGHAGACD